MDKSEIAQKLTGLAKDLKSISAEASHAKLTDLANLVEGTDPKQWCELRTYDALPPADVEAFVRETLSELPLWLRTAAVLRNASFIVPVVFTWAALAAAASNYSIATQTDPELKASTFLELWQSGFHGLGQPLLGFVSTFSQVAQIDAILLLVVLVLAIGVPWWENRITSEADRRARSFKSRLDSVLWQLEKLATSARYELALGTVEGVMGPATSIMRHIEAEHTRLVELAKTRETETTNLVTFSKKFGSDLKLLVKSSSETRDAFDSVAKVTERLGLGIARLDQQLEALHGVLVRLEEATLSSEDAERTLREALLVSGSEVTTTLEQIQNSQDVVRVWAMEVASHYDKVVEHVVQIPEDVTSHLSQFTTQFVDKLAGVMASVDEFRDEVAKMPSALESSTLSIMEAASSTAQAAKRLEEVHASTSEMVNALSTRSGEQLDIAVMTLSGQHERLTTLIETLESAALNLRDMPRALAIVLAERPNHAGDNPAHENN